MKNKVTSLYEESRRKQSIIHKNTYFDWFFQTDTYYFSEKKLRKLLYRTYSPMKKNALIMTTLVLSSLILAGCWAKKEALTTENTIPKNCIVWFDGCNNCFVQDGKIGGCTRMACEVQKQAKCAAFSGENNK